MQQHQHQHLPHRERVYPWEQQSHHQQQLQQPLSPGPFNATATHPPGHQQQQPLSPGSMNAAAIPLEKASVFRRSAGPSPVPRHAPSLLPGQAVAGMAAVAGIASVAPYPPSPSPPPLVPVLQPLHAQPRGGRGVAGRGAAGKEIAAGLYPDLMSLLSASSGAVAAEHQVAHQKRSLQVVMPNGQVRGL